jgi:hypothetical protein
MTKLVDSVSACQCCGTVMIYCYFGSGSASVFYKVSVPAQASIPDQGNIYFNFLIF